MSDGSTQRKRRTPEEWQQLVEACDASGLSQAAFCQQQDLALSTFQYWKRRLRKAPTAPGGVIDLGDLRAGSQTPVTNSPTGWIFELLLGNWLRVQLRRA